ncbi:MAG: hypothetical protein GY938_06455, partial [Ketobacter sp.]|nr:hypothetical protein [Ketobacter sp.]
LASNAPIDTDLLRTFKNPSNPPTTPTMNRYYHWTTNNPTPKDYSDDIRKKSMDAHRIGLIHAPQGKITPSDIKRLNNNLINPLNSATAPIPTPMNITPRGTTNTADITAALGHVVPTTGFASITAGFDQFSEKNVRKKRMLERETKNELYHDFPMNGDSDSEVHTSDDEERMSQLGQSWNISSISNNQTIDSN